MMPNRSAKVRKLLLDPSGIAWADDFGKALYSWAKGSVPLTIRTLSLFTGVGGLDIGFHDAGFKITRMVEHDKRFVKTLEANSGKREYLGEAEPFCQDVRNYDPDENTKVDFIIGGPPCQPFSAAARRAAGVRGTIDEEGELFRDYIRIVKQLSPKGFLFENVVGLTNSDEGETWKKVVRSFKRAGYKISYRILDAADYGVPQHRKRLFIVGLKTGEYRFPQPMFGPASSNKTPYITAKQALKGLRLATTVRKYRVNGKYGQLLDAIPPGLNYCFYTEKMGHPHPIFAWRSKFYDFLYKADPNKPVRTLKARAGQYTGPFHWQNRRFSIPELKRLQTIPDCYKVVGEEGPVRQQIGNAVPPQIARILALTILNQVFKVKLPLDLPLMQENKSLMTSISVTSTYSAITNTQTSVPDNVNERNNKDHARKYSAGLSDNFRFILGGRNKSHEVQFKPTKSSWHIVTFKKGETTGLGFSISIKPQLDKPWKLGVAFVNLSAPNLTSSNFSILWKAFELEMLRKKVKADLVQLSGYYSYEPAFVCEMTFDQEPADQIWKVVQHVIRGVGVREISSRRSLSHLWGIPESEVIKSVLFLRSLGYDVRNHKTNPRIKDGYFLIPYTFPSLNPASVQRHKQLK